MSFESMLHVLHGNKVIFIVIVIVMLGYPANWQMLFVQPFVHAQIKQNKAPGHRPLWGESTDDR